MTALAALFLRRARVLQLWLALGVALGLLVMGSTPAKAWGPLATQQAASSCATAWAAAQAAAAQPEAAAGLSADTMVDSSVAGAELGDGLEAPELGLPPSGLRLGATNPSPPGAKVPRLLGAPWLEGLQRPPRPRGG